MHNYKYVWVVDSFPIYWRNISFFSKLTFSGFILRLWSASLTPNFKYYGILILWHTDKCDKSNSRSFATIFGLRLVVCCLTNSGSYSAHVFYSAFNVKAGLANGKHTFHPHNIPAITCPWISVCLPACLLRLQWQVVTNCRLPSGLARRWAVNHGENIKCPGPGMAWRLQCLPFPLCFCPAGWLSEEQSSLGLSSRPEASPSHRAFALSRTQENAPAVCGGKVPSRTPQFHLF